MVKHYFAYGSNMNPERMKARGLETVAITAGKLKGFRLTFNKRAHNQHNVAYANVSYASSASVEGVLYQLRNARDISVMDGFEGTPFRYSRDVFPIETIDGTINAWVYVANRAMLQEGLLPEQRYLQHLLKGKPWLSEEYYQQLVVQPCKPSDKAALLPKSEHLKFNA